MAFWTHLSLVDLLILSLFLLLAHGVSRAFPSYRRLALPPAVLAGMLALLFGPSGVGWFDLDAHTLQAIVYHGLALVFVSIGLQSKPPGRTSEGARSIALSIPFITCGQALLGLGVVLVWSMAWQSLHPGVGLMLPLGFSQGPGQALSMGNYWEETGMVAGGQIGLTLAALGYLVCIALGLGLYHLAKRLGWQTSAVSEPQEVSADVSQSASSDATEGLEPLTAQAALVGTVYLATFGVLSALSTLVADQPKAVAKIWAFHFLIALLVAGATRFSLSRLPRLSLTNDRLLGRLAGVAVDLTAAGAIAAIQFDAVADFIVPIIALAVPGAVLTLLACVWFAKRAFPNQPFPHALVLFGTMTGTLPTGMTLLRLADPELRGLAARNVVVGVGLSVIPAAPLIVKVIQMPIEGWPETFPTAVWQTMGVLVLYMLVLGAIWRFFGPLRSVGRATQLWPSTAHPLSDK